MAAYEVTALCLTCAGSDGTPHPIGFDTYDGPPSRKADREAVAGLVALHLSANPEHTIECRRETVEAAAERRAGDAARAKADLEQAKRDREHAERARPTHQRGPSVLGSALDWAVGRR